MKRFFGLIKSMLDCIITSIHWLVGVMLIGVGMIGIFLPFIPGLLLIFLGCSVLGFKAARHMYKRQKHKRR